MKQAIAGKTKLKEGKNPASDAVVTLDKEIAALTKRYQEVVASLQIVFNVVPQRNYTYNPQNATLYLNVSDEEVETMKQKIAELQKQEEAKKKE